MNYAQRKPRALRLPPFAERVPASERSVWISAGPDAWARAKRWRWEGDPGLVAPPGVDPALIDWPVRGRAVRLIALDLPRPELVMLVDVLARSGAAIIIALHGPTEADQCDILVPGRDV